MPTVIADKASVSVSASVTFKQEVQFETGSGSEDAVRRRVSHLEHMLVSIIFVTTWNPGWSQKKIATEKLGK